MEQLTEAPWAFFPRSSEPHSRLVQLFARHGKAAPRFAVTTTSIALIKGLVIHGHHLSWLTAPMYESERHAGLINPLSLKDFEELRAFSIHRRRNGVLPRPAAAFLEVAREFFAEAKRHESARQVGT